MFMNHEQAKLVNTPLGGPFIKGSANEWLQLTLEGFVEKRGGEGGQLGFRLGLQPT